MQYHKFSTIHFGKYFKILFKKMKTTVLKMVSAVTFLLFVPSVYLLLFFCLYIKYINWLYNSCFWYALNKSK